MIVWRSNTPSKQNSSDLPYCGNSVCVTLQYSSYLALMGIWCWTPNFILQAQPWPITLSSEAQICPWRYGQIISKSNIKLFILKCPVILSYYLNVWDVKTDVWKLFQSCSLAFSRGEHCTTCSEGTKTQAGACPASVGRLGRQDLISTVRSFSFALLYGSSKNHFLHIFYHFVLLCTRILKRTGVVFNYCLVIFKAVNVSMSPRWAKSLHSEMVLCFFLSTYSESPSYSLGRCS